MKGKFGAFGLEKKVCNFLCITIELLCFLPFQVPSHTYRANPKGLLFTHW